MRAIQTLRQISGSWRFFLLMLLLHVGLYIWSRPVFFVGISTFIGILQKTWPALLLMFLLMAVINYFLTPSIIARHLNGRGLKKWLLAVIGGILSVGPIYLWYPILGDLKKGGLSDGWIACFLYNRAIKIPLLPLAIYYFNWQYVAVLTVVMVFASIAQAYILNYLIKKQ